MFVPTFGVMDVVFCRWMRGLGIGNGYWY